MLALFSSQILWSTENKGVAHCWAVPQRLKASDIYQTSTFIDPKMIDLIFHLYDLCTGQVGIDRNPGPSWGYHFLPRSGPGRGGHKN